MLPQYNKNGDGWLNAEERQAARQAMTGRQSRGMGRGSGGRGGPGGFGTTTSQGIKLTPADVKWYSSEPLYDLKTLRTIFLEFEENDWEAELEAFYHTDIDVPAKITVDGKTYDDKTPVNSCAEIAGFVKHLVENINYYGSYQ